MLTIEELDHVSSVQSLPLLIVVYRQGFLFPSYHFIHISAPDSTMQASYGGEYQL